MSSTPRKRRTPEQARALILDAAEARLRRLGLDGLNVTGVAEDAGLSHASVIHHFGNTAGMRGALAERMTQALVADIVKALRSDTEPALVIRALFQAMIGGGHARLLAWRSLHDALSEEESAKDEATQALFRELLAQTTARFGDRDNEEVRRCILLIASSAIGFGVAGPMLPLLLGEGDFDADVFSGWLSDLLLTGDDEGA
ncbi:MAG: TetR/AcrR family transcriptional regulator [Pseudomonadota bacterium]